MHSLIKQSAREIVSQLRSNKLSIEETLDCLQERIESVEPAVNALPTLCFDLARQRAKALQALPVEQRGPLAGLPVTIKDLTTVAGVKTTMGSSVFKDFVPDQSDRLVTHLESQGAVVYAKSNTPEFGTGGITFNEVFGITRSPHNTHFASGGSSGGAAASLAAGTAWISHGSDMAGSLRTPASFCGVSSLRPSPRTMQSDAAYLPFCALGAQGPMARNIGDLAMFADVMRDGGLNTLQDATEHAQTPARVAVSPNLGITEIDDDVHTAFSDFIDQLIRQGWNIEEKHPDLTGVHDAFDVLRAQFYAVNLEHVLRGHPNVMKPEVVWNITQGLALDSASIRDALRKQGQIVNQAEIFMHDYDVLLCPATSVSSVPAHLHYPGQDKGLPIPDYYRWLAIAYATTMTALPVITLPFADYDNGMPAGIQLVGKPGGEAPLFQIARHIEISLGRSNLPIEPNRGWR